MKDVASPSARPARKRRDRYHHGDLRPALIAAALGTIRREGVHALTLRGVGADLGVSRTALYRHFTDKSALLAAVGAEGFRTFRHELEAAWQTAGPGWAGFEAMGRRYIRFAIDNPSYYRVMFGGFHGERAAAAPDADLAREGAAAFQQLVDALAHLQRGGLVRAGDLLVLARYVWATVHGVAMLAIDGMVAPPEADALAQFTVARIRDSLAASSSTPG